MTSIKLKCSGLLLNRQAKVKNTNHKRDGVIFVKLR